MSADEPKPSAGAAANPFANVQSSIDVLIAFAGVVAALVGSFVIPPVFNHDFSSAVSASTSIVSLGRFGVAIVVAAVLFPLLRFSGREYGVYWSVLALVAFAGALWMYSALIGDEIRYIHHVDYSATNVHQTFVSSDTLTDLAKEYIKEYKGRSGIPPDAVALYLAYSGTGPEGNYLAWDRESIVRRELLFAAQYLAVLLAFSIAIVAAGQSVRCFAQET